MQAVITHPGGVEHGIASPAARGEIDVDSAGVEQVIRRSHSQSSIERLEVYSNAYHARLLECLRDEFPALVHLVGEETFNGLAVAYLHAHPSQSYTLAELGAKFPEYLATVRPPADPDVPGPDAGDLIIDLARLERAYAEVFDGPGIETIEALSVETLLAVPEARRSEMRLVPAPCLRLMQFSYPVHQYATAVRNGLKPEAPVPEPTWLVITRRDYVVRRLPVACAAYSILERLAAGASLGEAIEAAVLASAATSLPTADQLWSWFRDWILSGYFTRIELPE